MKFFNTEEKHLLEFEHVENISFNDLAKKIMELECTQKFTFDWCLSIDGDKESKIFSHQPNWKVQTVADFLNIKDFSKCYPITLKHKGAGSESEAKSGTIFFSNEAAPNGACWVT